MFQAITTKYLGPTNVRGSRVKAACDAGSITLDWNDALHRDQNHSAAAKALAERYKWNGFYVGGSISHLGGAYAFVNVTHKYEYDEELGPQFDYDFEVGPRP